MGLIGVVLSLVGFGFGLSFGLFVGYFLFFFFEPRDVKEPITRTIQKSDSLALLSLVPNIPLWVKSPDYDRVCWLNRFISFMWPYMNKALCHTLHSTVKPIFDEYTGSFRIESIKFSRLTLGSLPPIISGIKILNTQDKDLLIETEIRWAGNPDISIEVEWFQWKLTLQLIDLQVFITSRLTLKPLLPTFPCFGNVGISLMEKPYVDFGLRLAGADVMAIPGLYQLVQGKIKEQVSNMYHWPKSLDVPILDVCSGAANKPVGILHVIIVRALNLQKMDILGKSDPYVELSLSNERFKSRKTTVKMKNLNPEWDEHFNLSVKDPQTQVLQLHLYDWEKVKAHDKLGMQVIPLNLLIPNETKRFTLDLLKNQNPNDPQNRRNRGKIVVDLRFDPFIEDDEIFDESMDGDDSIRRSIKRSLREPSNGGVLLVTIERAENIQGKRHNNPYAVILFKGESRKTKRIKNSRDPRWNEEFEFTLEEPPSDEKMHIKVMSKRKRGFVFLSKESLGHVDINLLDVVNNGRINEKYHLINSRSGVIQVEMRWRTIQ